jgi:hypothetical protein
VEFILEGDEMKKQRLAGIAALWLAACVPNLMAQAKPQEKPQDKPQSAERRDDEYRFSLASLKVQVVFTEYEGDKKLKSLPYSFLVTTRTRDEGSYTKIRVGNRVPVYVGGGAGGSQTVSSQSYTYLDVGTNIDSWAEGVGPGQYRVHLSLERSWVEGNVYVPIEKAGATQNTSPPGFSQPIVRQYRAELTPILKDGQTLETTLATDPLSGRVVKLEVSISVLK